VERIVLHNHQIGELLQILGIQDKVVGFRDRYRKEQRRFPIMSQATDVGDGNDPNIEATLNVNPDVIIVYWAGKSAVKELYAGKIPDRIKVLRMVGNRAANRDTPVPEVITMLGYLLNRRDQAVHYIEWHDNIVNLVVERVSKIPENERVRVWIDTAGYATAPKGPTTARMSIGRGHNLHDVLELAGGINIGVGHIPLSHGGQEYGDLELEFILSQNPDVIIGRGGPNPYETDDDGPLKDYYEELKNLPGFGKVKAVQDDRVYIMTNGYALTPNYPSALAAMVKWFYPDHFSDLDPMKIHQEYVDMQGLQFDVSTQGAFLYPLPE
jgi:iron complex transport system substrate-binding protein